MRWVKYPDVEYQKSISVMHGYLNGVINGGQDVVMLCQYSDVITKGTSTEDPDILNGISIPIYDTDRGGRATYHGPGQRVVYPIININKPPWKKDIKKYINFLEQWMIICLNRFNIDCYAKDSIGIWCKGKKIGFIGLRVKKYCAFHGFAINVSTSLDMYKNIKACGLNNDEITSMENLGVKISISEFDLALKLAYHDSISKFI